MSLNDVNGTHLQAAPTCASCGQLPQVTVAAPNRFVYAIGRVEARFPKQSIEKEYFQAVARVETKGLTDMEVQHKVLSQRVNRYIARQMCWAFCVEGIDTYVLVPRDPTDIDLMIDALDKNPQSSDIDVIVGLLGPIAPPDLCNGLSLPIVIFDQLYSFDESALIESIPTPEGTDIQVFRRSSAELLNRVKQIADNRGDLDTHRALNYLVVRYPAIYSRVVDAFNNDYSLTRVDALASPLSGARKIVEVVLCFAKRSSEFSEKYSVRVDVTDEFPFLFSKLTFYLER
jgi:hypothetical protein